jgi:RNA polymerase sigma-70 factor (ECF subfamily)
LERNCNIFFKPHHILGSLSPFKTDNLIMIKEPKLDGKPDEGGFDRELTQSQSDLFVYISALTGSAEAARDILQETNLVLCRESGRYDTSRPFLPWARTVAYYQVLSWRKRNYRERLVFDDALLEDIAESLNGETAVPHAQLDALAGCLKKLPERMRSLFEARYAKGLRVDELAAACGRAPNAVAASLYRIRQLLRACIEDVLGEKSNANS